MSFTTTCRVRATARQVEDALLLLRTGRTDMAGRLLEGLPQKISSEIRASYEEGCKDVGRARTALSEALQRAAALEREVARLKARPAPSAKAPIGALAQPRAPAARQLPTNASGLAAALADGRTTPGRVAELLKIRPEDVRPIAEGRVGLASSAWQRVLAEIAA